MSVELNQLDGGKTLEIKISGKLLKEDYERFMPELDRLIDQFGKIRLLVEMQDFHGWSAGALWEDIKLDWKHYSDIERVAFVGDKRWQKGMSIFCRPFTTAKIRYFELSDLASALEWIEQPAQSVKSPSV
jgi:hypothetical protein